MINSRFSVAIHILTLVASQAECHLKSEIIASSVNTNPVVIRRINGMLKKAGILSSKAGVIGSTLTRDPSNIKLLDIYKAVQTEDDLFAVHEKPNPECPIGEKIQQTINTSFQKVQAAMEKELAKQTLQDILDHLHS
ncbi:Rrf2 family transcriptional regulator [Metabacillus arenae]|uniref:Rrf2 family transcriptional regulator n=1 Tax=Metabacillus arenae TaxID=2771434 RepID=A0A926NBA8_9BACI|nr:Rrf2 family transcriptional regulator [Metabacillus arenae]MBD1381082.1 Rrf2 family transcriptional regulator [Metabacillus arenae]